MKFIGLAVALLLATYSPIAAVEHKGIVTQGVASVIDGDTLEIHGSRIRLHGIDAPESRQACTESNGAAWRCGQAAALMEWTLATPGGMLWCPTRRLRE